MLADLCADAEDASLILAEAERQHAVAVAADGDARRRTAYDAARAQADAAAADLAKLYPRLAFDIVALLGRVAAAQQAVAVVNADLPIGFGPIVDPETVARGTAGLPRDVLDEREVVLWAHVFTPAAPAPDEQQAEIHPTKAGYGISPGAHSPYFRRHRYVRREVRAAVNGFQPEPLADVLQLPAFGRGFVWQLPENGGALDVASVLARADAVEAEAVAEPVAVERPVKVEWEDLGEVDPGETWEEPVYDMVRTQAPDGSRFAASPFDRPGSRPARRT